MPHKQRSQNYFNFVQNTTREKQVSCEFFGFDFASWCLANKEEQQQQHREYKSRHIYTERDVLYI